MNINFTFFGQVVFLLALLAIPLCYYLGKRKTDSPILCATLGFFAAFIPPLLIIHLAILAYKPNKQAS